MSETACVVSYMRQEANLKLYIRYELHQRGMLRYEEHSDAAHTLLFTYTFDVRESTY